MRHRLFVLAILLAAVGIPIARDARAAEPPVDAPLPRGAVSLPEPNRYRSPRNFDETLDFYRRLFHSTGGVRWRTIVNQQGLRARHVESLRKRTRWSGINITEHHGEVGIYVLTRPTQP